MTLITRGKSLANQNHSNKMVHSQDQQFMLLFASLLLLLAASSLKRKRSNDDENLPAAKAIRLPNEIDFSRKRANLGELEGGPLQKRQRTGLFQRKGRLEVVDRKRKLEATDTREPKRPRLLDEETLVEPEEEEPFNHDQLEALIAIIKRLRTTDTCAHDTRGEGNPWGQGPGNAGAVC